MLNIPANEQDIIARQSNDSGQFGTSGVIQRSNQSDGRDQFETPGPRGYPGRGGGSARVSHFGSPSLNRSLAVSFETPLRGPEGRFCLEVFLSIFLDYPCREMVTFHITINFFPLLLNAYVHTYTLHETSAL